MSSPQATIAAYADQTLAARAEIQAARQRLPQVRLSPTAEQAGLDLVRRLELDSLRAELTLFEAARAVAAADDRDTATPADVREVAPMALRLRRSAFMQEYFNAQQSEERQISALVDDVIPPAAPEAA